MPQIPIYDAPQVKAQGLPDTQLRVNVPNMAAPIAQGLGAVSAMAQEKTDQAQTTVVREKVNTLKDELNAAWTHIESLRGAQIRDPKMYGGVEGQDVTARFEEVAKGLRQQLTEGLTARQMDMFDQSALPTMTAMKQSVSQHEMKQYQVVEDATAAAAIEKNATTTYNLRNNPSAVEAGIAEAVRLADEDAKRAGLTPDLADMHRMKTISATLGPALEGLATGKDKNPELAKQLFEKFGSMMVPQQRQKMESVINAQVVATKSRDLGNQAAAQYGDNMETARIWIEKQAGTDTELRDRADAEYKDLINTRQAQKRIQNEEAVGDVFSTMLATPRMTKNQIKDLVANSKVDPSHWPDVIKKVESHYFGDPTEKALAREARSEQRAMKFIDYLVNPDKVAGLTEKQILSLVPELGPENTLSLARMKKAMTAQAGELDIPAQMLQTVIKETKMNDKKGSDAQLIALARESAINEILATQKAKGRQLSDEEKMPILKKNFRKEMVPGKIFGTNETLYGAVQDKNEIVQALPEKDRAEVMKIATKKGYTSFDPKTKSFKFNGTPEAFIEMTRAYQEQQKKQKVAK